MTRTLLESMSDLARPCQHRRRTTVIRSRIGTVEQCDDCGVAFNDEEIDRLNEDRDLAEERRANERLAP